jgi:large subunit ribosomal protein L28e
VLFKLRVSNFIPLPIVRLCNSLVELTFTSNQMVNMEFFLNIHRSFRVFSLSLLFAIPSESIIPVDMPAVSADLAWELIGKTNRFAQKRGGIRLSSDPFNNSGNNTKRHAGFLQNSAAAVKINGKTGTVYVAVKDGDAAKAQKPKSAFKSVSATGVKASEVSKIVAAVRPDLADVAFRRARKLAKTFANSKKVRAASKARSAKRTFKRTAKRASQKK